MNLKQLVYFVRAVEAGNITRAADDLHIAQTALGIQIRNLERELGVALLDRHSRGVKPTAAGDLLLRHARDILTRLESARDEVRAAGRGERVPVTFGITPSIMRLVGADLVMEVRREMPEVALKLVEEFSFKLQELLERGELDYALAYNCPDLPALARTPMLEEDLLFVSAPDQAAGEPTVRFSAAIRTDLALASRQDVIYHLVHAEAARLGIEVNVMYELQSVRAIKNLVAKGVATSFLPKGAMVEELRKGTLGARLVERPRLTRTLFLARQARGVGGLDAARLESLVGRIVDRLAAAIGEHARYL